MKTHKWKVYGLGIALAEAVGGLSGWLTRQGNRIYEQTVPKPPLTPPAWVFPVVWSILYALMGAGAARVYLTEPSAVRNRGLNLFIVQLTVNFFWSLIFFNARAYWFAFWWLTLLWVLVLWMILSFRQTDPLAAKLQVPYLLWLTFAAYLNFMVAGNI